jgi:hypothetical protein
MAATSVSAWESALNMIRLRPWLSTKAMLDPLGVHRIVRGGQRLDVGRRFDPHRYLRGLVVARLGLLRERPDFRQRGQPRGKRAQETHRDRTVFVLCRACGRSRGRPSLRSKPNRSYR